MRYERRCSVAIIVATVVTALSALPVSPVAIALGFAGLFLVALYLVVRVTAAEDATRHSVRRSAAVWLACSLLGAGLLVSAPPESFGLLFLRCLGAVALVDAVVFWPRLPRASTTSSAERPSS
jgi:hypothetical protein